MQKLQRLQKIVKVRIKNKITREVRTIACVYLEPTGDLRWIPKNIIGSDIVVGDFNGAETEMQR